MKVWVKLLLGMLSFLLLSCITYAFIKTSEGDKQAMTAVIHKHIARENADEAVRQSELAEKQAAMAMVAVAEATQQRALLEKTLEQLTNCSSKK